MKGQADGFKRVGDIETHASYANYGERPRFEQGTAVVKVSGVMSSQCRAGWVRADNAEPSVITNDRDASSFWLRAWLLCF
jgi:hypothetical protein